MMFAQCVFYLVHFEDVLEQNHTCLPQPAGLMASRWCLNATAMALQVVLECLGGLSRYRWMSALQHPTWLTLNIRARICFLREMLDVEQIVGKYRFQRFQTSCNSGYCQQGEKMAEPEIFTLPFFEMNLTLWPPQLGPTNVFTFKQKSGLWRVDNRVSEFWNLRRLKESRKRLRLTRIRYSYDSYVLIQLFLYPFM